jgi:hypothetical protein
VVAFAPEKFTPDEKAQSLSENVSYRLCGACWPDT